MANAFKDREIGAEWGHAHDQDMAFFVRSRQAYLLAAWAAGEMKTSADTIEPYTKDVAAMVTKSSSDSPLFQRIYSDLYAAGHSYPLSYIQVKFAGFQEQAREDVGADKQEGAVSGRTTNLDNRFSTGGALQKHDR